MNFRMISSNRGSLRLVQVMLMLVRITSLGGLTLLSKKARIARFSATSSPFLDQVEESVAKVLLKYNSETNILKLPSTERESLGVARNLNKRLLALARNNDCRRCWLQRAHCVCEQCVSLEEANARPLRDKVHRIFLLMHHKEVCLGVDTAKLILSTFPESCRLVIGGISSEHQESMKEFEEATKGNNCLVLFPTESARTFHQIHHDQEVCPKDGWDIVVIDGTWAQARKLHSRYIQEGTAHVELSTESVSRLGNASETCKEGHQLRRHPIKWKEVSTLEATRLLLRDMMSSTTTDRPWDTLALYQQIGDAAAKRQLGPHREPSKDFSPAA